MRDDLVIPDVCDYTVEHPVWCTKKHGAPLSRQQSHNHTWRSTHGKTLAMKLELHPSQGYRDWPPTVTIQASVTDPEPNRFAGAVLSVLTLPDVRSLIASLQFVADAIENETVSYADANGFDASEFGVPA